jgi:DNA-directed RNA polymerase subunit M/transcription elongation factor TFIIS
MSNVNNKLVYYCETCNKNIDAQPNDYLIFEDRIKSEQESVNFKYACEDITNPRKKIKCQVCENKEKVAVLIRLPETLENIFICCTCYNKVK